jgi:thioredoxin reductase
VNIELTDEGYYIATGEGELRPIVAEGNTDNEAKQFFYQAQCDQYEEAQRLDYLSLRSV